MNFFTKIHELFRQKEQIVKKSQKHDANLQKNSTLYFQVGLIICLLTTYALFEMYFETQIPNPITQTFDPGDTIFVASPVIEPKPRPVVKSEPKVDIIPRRLINPPIIVKDNVDVPKEEAPATETLPEDINPPVPVTTTPPVVNTQKDYNPLEINQIPVFPGCEGIVEKSEQMKCFSAKVNKLVQRKFDGYLQEELGLKGKQNIYVQFTIDAIGNVVDITAKASHEKLEKEAKRVINKIPQLQPGKYSNTPVNVVFSLPITLQALNY